MSLPTTKMTYAFNGSRKKLILLAFDPAAQPGEAVGAIRALAKTWVSKYNDGHELVRDLETPGTTGRTESPYETYV